MVLPNRVLMKSGDVTGGARYVMKWCLTFREEKER